MDDTIDSYVPDDLFKTVVNIESGGKQYDTSGDILTSPKGAEGATQVIPSTQKDPGFGVQPMKDKSPQEFMRFGKDYLSALYNKYSGSPEKAAAAYNAGPGAVDKLIEKHGDNWKDHLPTETKNYVEKVNENYKPAPTWDEVAQNPDFQKLPEDQKNAARDQYFKDVVEPRIKNKDQIAEVRKAFDTDTSGKPSTPIQTTPTKPTQLGGLQTAANMIQKATQGYAKGAEKLGLSKVTDYLSKEGESRQFSFLPVGVGGAIGTGLAWGLAPETGGLSLLAAGAIGAFSAGVGEAIRSSGGSEGAAITAELLTGGGYGTIKKLSSTPLGALTMPSAIKWASKFFPESSTEIKATLAAKEAMFGKDTFEGMGTIAHSEAIRKVLSNEATKLGMELDPAKKVSESIVKNIYKDTQNLTINMSDLSRQLTASGAKPEEIASIKRILENRAKPNLSEKANADIVNYMKHGGPFNPKANRVTDQVLSSDTRQAFENFMKEKLPKFEYKNPQTGEITQMSKYNYFDKAVNAEKIAEGLDSIPTLVQHGFENKAIYGNDAKMGLKSAIQNIMQSPTGKEDLAKAVNKHFYNIIDETKPSTLDPMKITKEWQRLRPILQETKAMSQTELTAIYDKIQSLPAAIGAQKRAILMRNIIANGLAPVIAGQVSKPFTSEGQ